MDRVRSHYAAGKTGNFVPNKARMAEIVKKAGAAFPLPPLWLTLGEKPLYKRPKKGYPMPHEKASFREIRSVFELLLDERLLCVRLYKAVYGADGLFGRRGGAAVGVQLRRLHAAAAPAG